MRLHAGGHPAMAAGSFEPEETRLVRELMQQVDILVNVGANVGTTAAMRSSW